MSPPYLCHSGASPDGGQGSLVLVPESRPRIRPGLDEIGREATHLLGGRRHSGDGLRSVRDRSQVPDHEYPGVARDGEVRLDDHASRPIEFGTQSVEGLAEGRSLHPGRPDLRGRADHLRGFSVGHSGAGGVDIRDSPARAHLDAQLLELGGSLGRKWVRVMTQDLSIGLYEQDSRLGGIDRPEILVERVASHLGDRPGQLHAGRTPTDDHEREVALRISGTFRLLERLEDHGPDPRGVGDGLEARGVPLPFIVSEVVVRGPGRHDEHIERHGGGSGDDLVRFDIDNRVEDHMYVALMAEDVANR